MTDQKHEDTATTEGMPEVAVKHDAPPPVLNEFVEPGAEKFTAPPVTPPSPLEIEVARLKVKLHDMEEVVHTYLSHQTGVGHERISAWLTKVGRRITLWGSTPPQAPTTGQPSTPSVENSSKDSQVPGASA